MVEGSRMGWWSGDGPWEKVRGRAEELLGIWALEVRGREHLGLKCFRPGVQETGWCLIGSNPGMASGF